MDKKTYNEKVKQTAPKPTNSERLFLRFWLAG